MLLQELLVRVAADVGGLKDVDRAGRDTVAVLNSVGDSAGKIGGRLSAAITAPLVGLAGVATKFAADFDLAMRQVTSLLGTEGEAAFRGLHDQTLALSRSLGIDATGAAKALYETISAGVPKENAISFLEVASKAAVAGVTDTKVAVDGLTNVINAWKLEASDAAEISDAMFQAVNVGKMTFAELAASIGQASGMAATLGVNYKELLASAATITKQGSNASEAFTQLQAAMKSLVDPTEQMAALIQKAGYASGEALVKAKGLQGALEAVRVAADGNAGTLTKATGRIEGFRAIVALTGQSAKMAAADMETLRNSAGAAGKAFDEIDKAFARQAERLVNEAKGMAIELGTALLPIGGQVLESLKPVTSGISEMVRGFASLPPAVQQGTATLLALAAAAGPAMLAVSGISKAMAAMVSFGQGLGAVAGSIGNVAFAIGNNLYGALNSTELAFMRFAGVAVTAWGAFSAWQQLGGVGENIRSIGRDAAALSPTLLEMGNAIAATVTPAVAEMGNGIRTAASLFPGMGAAAQEVSVFIDGLRVAADVAARSLKGLAEVEWGQKLRDNAKGAVSVLDDVTAKGAELLGKLREFWNTDTAPLATSFENALGKIRVSFRTTAEEATDAGSKLNQSFNSGTASIAIAAGEYVKAHEAQIASVTKLRAVVAELTKEQQAGKDVDAALAAAKKDLKKAIDGLSESTQSHILSAAELIEKQRNLNDEVVRAQAVFERIKALYEAGKVSAEVFAAAQDQLTKSMDAAIGTGQQWEVILAKLIHDQEVGREQAYQSARAAMEALNMYRDGTAEANAAHELLRKTFQNVGTAGLEVWKRLVQEAGGYTAEVINGNTKTQQAFGVSADKARALNEVYRAITGEANKALDAVGNTASKTVQYFDNGARAVEVLNGHVSKTASGLQASASAAGTVADEALRIAPPIYDAATGAYGLGDGLQSAAASAASLAMQAVDAFTSMTELWRVTTATVLQLDLLGAALAGTPYSTRWTPSPLGGGSVEIIGGPEGTTSGAVPAKGVPTRPEEPRGRRGGYEQPAAPAAPAPNPYTGAPPASTGLPSQQGPVPVKVTAPVAMNEQQLKTQQQRLLDLIRAGAPLGEIYQLASQIGASVQKSVNQQNTLVVQFRDALGNWEETQQRLAYDLTNQLVGIGATTEEALRDLARQMGVSYEDLVNSTSKAVTQSVQGAITSVGEAFTDAVVAWSTREMGMTPGESQFYGGGGSWLPRTPEREAYLKEIEELLKKNGGPLISAGQYLYDAVVKWNTRDMGMTPEESQFYGGSFQGPGVPYNPEIEALLKKTGGPLMSSFDLKPASQGAGPLLDFPAMLPPETITALQTALDGMGDTFRLNQLSGTQDVVAAVREVTKAITTNQLTPQDIANLRPNIEISNNVFRSREDLDYLTDRAKSLF